MGGNRCGLIGIVLAEVLSLWVVTYSGDGLAEEREHDTGEGVMVAPQVDPGMETHFETFQSPTCGFIPCPVTASGNVLTLTASCATYSSLLIPDGYTLDGAGHFIAAVDAPGQRFVGPIVRNCGSSAFYRNLRLMAVGLSNICDSGDDALTGIRFDNASGSVTNTQIFNIRQGDGTSGCQEGIGIAIRNQEPGAPTRVVAVGNNILTGYQKAGIMAVGNVDVGIIGNRISGAGPIGNIAQVGIQIGLGATGVIVANDVSGHSYTGQGVASGILVYGGGLYGGPLSSNVAIRDNQLYNNDIGVYLSQGNADGSPPSVRTNIAVVDNILENGAVTNGYVYQAGIADLGTGNIIHSNRITGPGYDPATLPGSTFAVDVVAGPAVGLTFLTQAQQVAVGACSGPVVVQSQDVNGNLSIPALTDFSITPVGEAALGIQFYADASCTGPALTSLDLSNPEASGRFYFRAAVPGNVTLIVWNFIMTQFQTQQVVTGLAPGETSGLPVATSPVDASQG
ncbi:right-handed parallel beta-helix repeat-containing protein [Myxococcus sp. Y35]|uniref:right-handed parallel beta-helix repeat-containing protein n=1 Tax=Pseudomyxococcus flavus TaxID=3115648 RepID=UPI003CF89D86